MKIKAYLLFSLMIIIYGFQCGDDECLAYLYDTSSLDYSITPEQATIEIGDTLTLMYSGNDQIRIDEGMVDIDISNREIIQQFDLFQVNADNLPITTGTENFEITHSGTYLDTIQNTNGLRRIIFWGCSENDCLYTLKLIPQNSGYYGLRLLDGALKQLTECENYEFLNNTFLIQNNHIEILNEINTTEINIDVPRTFEGTVSPDGSFFFKVI